MGHHNRIVWPVEQIRKWVEEDGLKHREIAALLNTTDKMISKVCKRHQIQSQRRGPRGGAGHPEWKGGRLEDKNGYILVYAPDHPYARRYGHKSGRGRYILEHRLVMEQHLGRYLERSEVVHHKNGDNKDNRIENLELFSKNSEHLRHELAGKCPNWSPEGRAKILQALGSKVHNPFGIVPDGSSKPQTTDR